MSPRCFITAWITAWVTSVFLPSVIIAYLGLSQAAAEVGTGMSRLPASTWKVADDVGPVVKLIIGGFLLAGQFGLGQMTRVTLRARYAAGVAIGVITAAIPIALVPISLSRGFGAALTGTRFSPLITSIYVLGGVVAGLALVFSADRCTRAFISRGPNSPPAK